MKHDWQPRFKPEPDVRAGSTAEEHGPLAPGALFEVMRKRSTENRPLAENDGQIDLG